MNDNKRTMRKAMGQVKFGKIKDDIQPKQATQEIYDFVIRQRNASLDFAREDIPKQLVINTFNKILKDLEIVLHNL